ncbi:MAG: cupin domain-containing protein [Halobacteriota archaeon]
MNKIRIADVPNRIQPCSIRRSLTAPLGTTGLAINYYELVPGESFAFAFHAHDTQEEVFYVQSGTATFETEGDDVVVEAGEVVRFAPGEFQRGVNEGPERVVAIALGAPRDAGESTKLRECETCGERTENELEHDDDADEGALVAVCTTCGTRTGRWTRGPE